MHQVGKVFRSRAVKVVSAVAAATAGAVSFAQFEIGAIGGQAAAIVNDAGTAATAYVPVAIGLTLAIRWAYKIFGG